MQINNTSIAAFVVNLIVFYVVAFVLMEQVTGNYGFQLLAGSGVLVYGLIMRMLGWLEGLDE